MRLIDPKKPTNRLYVSDFVMEQMQKIPTIEAESVIHGRWVLKERAHYFKCSLCNEPIPYKFGYDGSRRYYSYCPNCGAKMDGGADHED